MSDTLCGIARVRHLCLTVVCLLSLSGMLAAQVAPQSTACSVDESAPTQADFALFEHDFKLSERLFAAAYARDHTDHRSRYLEIESLLGWGRLDLAGRETQVWISSSPDDSYAVLADGEIRYARGDWAGYYAAQRAALALNACLPFAFSNLGDYETLTGLRATARKHFAVAHQLAPKSPAIRMQWMQSLNHAQQLVEIENFLKDSSKFNEVDHNFIVHQLIQFKAILDNQCELPPLEAAVEIPMTPVYGRFGISHYALEVAFNGRKRLLKLDTGASGFTLTHSTGATLSLPVLAKSHLGGFGGQAENSSLLSKAVSVRVGDLEFRNCAVEVLANSGVLGGSSQMGRRLDDSDGIVGTDIFQRSLVTLDYVQHVIRLDPLPELPDQNTARSPGDATNDDEDSPDWRDRVIPPSMQSWTTIFLKSHQLILPVNLFTNKKVMSKLLFVLDTGAASNLIDIRLARKFTRTKETSVDILGLAGRVKNVSETGKLAIEVAGLKLPLHSMQAIDLSGFPGISGFLGYPTLSQLVIHIDYRDGLLQIEAPAGYEQ